MGDKTERLGFRLGTGAFAFVLILIVGAIGFELTAAVDAVDSEVRLRLLAHDHAGIRSPASSARCRSSGARSTRRSWRSLIATPIALGIAVFISELCPAWLRQPLVFLTELLAAIPSIVYGLWGIFVLVPAVRALETSMPDVAAAAADLQRPAARRRHAVGRR